MNEKELAQMPKINAYAMATDGDIAATRFEQVRDGKLWRGYFGTVYGCKVSFSGQVGFDTYGEARADAMAFVEQCAELVSEKANKP